MNPYPDSDSDTDDPLDAELLLRLRTTLQGLPLPPSLADTPRVVQRCREGETRVYRAFAWRRRIVWGVVSMFLLLTIVCIGVWLWQPRHEDSKPAPSPIPKPQDHGRQPESEGNGLTTPSLANPGVNTIQKYERSPSDPGFNLSPSEGRKLREDIQVSTSKKDVAVLEITPERILVLKPVNLTTIKENVIAFHIESDGYLSGGKRISVLVVFNENGYQDKLMRLLSSKLTSEDLRTILNASDEEAIQEIIHNALTSMDPSEGEWLGSKSDLLLLNEKK